MRLAVFKNRELAVFDGTKLQVYDISHLINQGFPINILNLSSRDIIPPPMKPADNLGESNPKIENPDQVEESPEGWE